MPPTKGVYVLLIEVASRVLLEIKSLGYVKLPQGRYVYVGSAKGPGGLRGRMARHFKKRKKLWWHIDYLLSEPSSKLVLAVYAETMNLSECDIVRTLLGRGAYAPIMGFGSSDCRAGCPAHLLAGVWLNDVLEAFRELGLVPRVVRWREAGH